MDDINNLISKNRHWASEMLQTDPSFFSKLASQQTPEYLWIGCADSRVPANQIVGLMPGEMFVHRNVSNLVVHTDLNCLSVMQFAVDVLKVRHIIVCGHYGCGGVRAALSHSRLGLIDNWLRHIQDVQARHEIAINALPDAHAQADRLCELNVIEQVVNVCRTTVVNDAWEKGQKLAVHGIIYGVGDGLLQSLNVSVESPSQLEKTYRQAVARVIDAGRTSAGGIHLNQ